MSLLKLDTRTRALIELERRRRRRIAAEAARTSRNIPADLSFLDWCYELQAKGMKVDGRPFRLDDRPALIPLYQAIPRTQDEARGLILVVQKATQLGITVWEVLANTYMALKWEPCTIGMFLPDQNTASYKSEQRFMRVIRSVPELYEKLVTRPADAKTIGEGNKLTRQMGESIFLFLWTSGKVSTESRPMDIVTLDEVQEMDLHEIDKVRARTGDSDIELTLMLSTANMPDLDINFWYHQGDQQVWHTECPHCHALSDLSDPSGIFPDKSIGYIDGDYRWLCPECSGVIEDPQQGRMVAQNPEANPHVRSFLLPRTISPRMTPRKMIEAWGRAKTGDQKKSFYNRTLARPYIDADQLPVTLAQCDACVQEGLRAGVVWEVSGRDTYMGVDQMGGFNAIIIKRRLPDGRQAAIHVEAVFDLDPFVRTAELMTQYGVTCCVVEQLPNVNDARKFANAFPGRVFLASYADLKDSSLLWGDELTASDRKTSDEDRSRYSVTLNQYKCMQTALYRIRDRLCLFPDPDALIQDVIEDGVSRRIPILRDWVFMHFTKTALVVEEHEETRRLRPVVRKVGIDPHFSFANMLCDVAWARAWGTSMFIFPDPPKEAAMPQDSKRGLPEHARRTIEMINESVLSGDVCGRCSAFQDGYCSEQQVRVKPDDPGCPFFDGAPGR